METTVETAALEAVRTELHALINQIHKADVLEAVRLLLRPQVAAEADVWEELGPEAQALVLRSMESAKAGRTMSGEQFLEKISTI